MKYGIFTVILIGLVTGCGAHQTRTYFVPEPNENWTHGTGYISIYGSEYYRYDCNNRKILLRPILWDKKVKYGVCLGIPLPIYSPKDYRANYLRDFHDLFGGKYNSKNALFVEVNFINFHGYNVPSPHIVINGTKYAPVFRYDPRLTIDEGEYGRTFFFIFDIDLKNVDKMDLIFDAFDGICNPSSIECIKALEDKLHWDGPIQ